MAVFKCKMCGGTIEFEQGSTVGVCDSCGTKQTLPRLDDEKRANLYDRANHFRRNNDFDKAMGIYEQILSEDNTDAEAYWSIVLCRYGIEYVKDPATHKRVPTVNRAQFTSIFADEDYKSALQYADGYQKEIYEQEAKAIDEIQKGILAISQKEEPFDVFICYKETDKDGRRTQDSVLANDLYHQLRQEGFKVFFSRITLEDKLGTAYEPYIFAALNSAKVMVVLGTKAEYFNAVWVKNEWSRYLALVKKSGGKKMLIPAYRDMDPYDLPEEFSHLQAQDMSKLGFMQDLIRGIKKIISVSAPKPAAGDAVVINSGNANVEPLLKRAFMFLEDGNWHEADEYCEKVLDQDPENAAAYLGKLMAQLQVSKQEKLADCEEPFADNSNYQKALRFGNADLQSVLKGYIKHINERNAADKLESTYTSALNTMKNAQRELDFLSAAERFEDIPDYKDSKELAEQCRQMAETAAKDDKILKAKQLISGRTLSDLDRALKILEPISGWKDADELITVCKKGIEEIKAEQERIRLEQEHKAEEKRIAAEKRKKRNIKIAKIGAPILCACIAFVIVLVTVIMPAIDKRNFISKYGQKAYDMFGTAEEGSIVKFGKYEQDNDESNGQEDIEWQVLDIKDGKMLLVSRYALDCQPYNTELTDVTWETCTLRNWLNNTFYSGTFTEDERALIADSTVYAQANPQYNTDPGNDTTDKVFLLSINEVEEYFSSNEERMCVPTAYAIANGAYTSDTYEKGGEATCWWWLRSPGIDQGYAAFVDYDGSVPYYGLTVNIDRDAVRPALWINLKS